MLVQNLRYTQFRAYTIGSGYQYGFLHTAKIRRKQAAKTADIGNNPGNKGTLNMFLHQAYAFISSLNINSGSRIGSRMRFCHDYSFPVQQYVQTCERSIPIASSN